VPTLVVNYENLITDLLIEKDDRIYGISHAEHNYQCTNNSIHKGFQTVDKFKDAILSKNLTLTLNVSAPISNRFLVDTFLLDGSPLVKPCIYSGTVTSQLKWKYKFPYSKGSC